MRLQRVQKGLDEKGFPYTYVEEDGCGSVNFEYRGVVYHVWEFCEDGTWGVETNVKNIGRHEDIYGDYEQEILELIELWK